MHRRSLALVLLATLILATAAPAAATERPPRACVAVSPAAPRCHRSATFEQGRPVTLRATTPGIVWRRAPRGRWFVALDRTDGRGRWTWTPLRRDVHPAAPYTFRVTTPAGSSNTVEIWIVPRHG